jgi:hypothetical protein
MYRLVGLIFRTIDIKNPIIEVGVGHMINITNLIFIIIFVVTLSILFCRGDNIKGDSNNKIQN